MSTKILTDYKSPVISDGIRDTLLSFMPPGRYHGFDELVAGSSGSNPIKLKIQHATTVKLDDGISYAAIFAPQGLLIFTTDTLEGSVMGNSGSLYECYLAFATINLDTSIPENSSWTMILDMTVIPVADYTTVDMMDYISNPDTQVPLGLVVVPPGGSVVGDLIYVKYAQQPFGYETAASEELAWRTKDNHFHGVNSTNPQGSDGNIDRVGSTLVLRGTNAWVNDVGSPGISNFRKYSDDGVTVEDFPYGTLLTITFTGTGGFFNASIGSNIYISGHPSALPIVSGASYQFILSSGLDWFIVSGFSALYTTKLDKASVAWSNLAVDTSGNLTAGNFSYRVDSDGQTHIRGYIKSSPFTAIADVKITTTALPTDARPTETIRVEGFTANVSNWVTNPIPIVFLLKPDGFFYICNGSFVVDSVDIYLSEVNFSV